MLVEPSISPDQIFTIVAFLLLLFTLMWLIKRNRGGITSRLRAARRMTHIEDLSLAPHQRLHLVEVDGRTFMVHAGKGHAASFIAVDGGQLAEMAPGLAETVTAKRVKSKSMVAAKESVGNAGKAAPKAARPVRALAAAIAAARRNNPSVEFGK